MTEALACLSCPRPMCQEGCPTGNMIRDFIACCKQDDFANAAEILYSTNPFPEITSSVCDHKRQCQGHCVKFRMGKPVNIPLIEAEISAKVPRNLQIKPSNGKSVALVGAGIGNLTCAYYLLKEGFSVDIFEKESHLGGAIYTGIPGYRFDKNKLVAIENDLLTMGAVFHYQETIKDYKALRHNFDEVVIGIGASKEGKGGLPEARGFFGGLSLLYDLNVLGLKEKYSLHKKAYVWGGGNVALDCARSLIRIVDEVTIIYRRSRKEMPASDDEIEEALKEGVKLDFLHNIVDLETDLVGNLVKLHCVKMELGEPDASGRASCHEIPGSDYTVDADLLVAAVGQKIDLASVGLSEEEKNSVRLVGDCHLGPKTVAACIKDGNAAAKEIIAKYR